MRDKVIIITNLSISFRYSTILKEVVVPLVKNEKCQNDLRENTRLGIYFELDNSFICAGGQKDIDTCKGDGGSPLTCRQPKGPWFQVEYLKLRRRQCLLNEDSDFEKGSNPCLTPQMITLYR